MRVAGFGEIMLRLSTDKGNMITNSTDFKVNYGGGEANVLISLSKFGIESRFISKVSNDDIGDSIIEYLNRNRVETSFVKQTEGRTGIYFLQMGSGNRASKVIYDRDNSVFSNMAEEDIDIELALQDVDIFHFSGVTLALSNELRELTIKILEYCKQNNIIISYDSNYRAKLWSLEEAREMMLKVLPYVNILSAGILDCENILQMSCDEVDRYKKLEYYYDELSVTYSNINHIFSSMRENISTSANTLQCNYYTNGRLYSSKIHNIDDIVDRVGGGDALTAGILYSIISWKTPKYIAEFSTCASVLKHSIKGDANLASRMDVESLMNNGVGKISR